MATTTATPAAESRTAEILEKSEQLEAELRAGAIQEIRDNITEFLDWEEFPPETAQILTLRDILMWTNSHGRNVLSGVAIVLDREDPNAVFVSYEHLDSVEKFIEMLPELKSHSPNPEWDRRMALIERVIEMRESDIEHVGFALDAIENSRGTGTPEEEFTETIIMLFGMRRLNPSSLNRAIVQLRDDLNNMAEDAANFAKRFPGGYDAEQEWPVLPEGEDA